MSGHLSSHPSDRGGRVSRAVQLTIGVALFLLAGAGVAVGAVVTGPSTTEGPTPTIETAEEPTAQEASRLQDGVSDLEYKDAVHETAACLFEGDVTASAPERDSAGRWTFHMTYPRDDADRADQVYVECYTRLMDQVEAAWLDAHQSPPVDPPPESESKSRAEQREQRASEVKAREERQEEQHVSGP